MISLLPTSCGSIDDMNKNLMRKFATATLAAAFVAAPAIALAPAALAETGPVGIVITNTDPTPAGDRLGVIETDGEQNIVAITTDVSPGGPLQGDFGLVGDIAVPCDQLDESVRVQVEGQENYCYLNRSHLARIAPGEPTPATVPGLDTSLGIMPISAPINLANPATDAANTGKLLSIALSAAAVVGTAVSLGRHRREGLAVK